MTAYRILQSDKAHRQALCRKISTPGDEGPGPGAVSPVVRAAGLEPARVTSMDKVSDGANCLGITPARSVYIW